MLKKKGKKTQSNPNKFFFDEKKKKKKKKKGKASRGRASVVHQNKSRQGDTKGDGGKTPGEGTPFLFHHNK